MIAATTKPIDNLTAFAVLTRTTPGLKARVWFRRSGLDQGDGAGVRGPRRGGGASDLPSAP
jgi:hypothetical protein